MLTHVCAMESQSGLPGAENPWQPEDTQGWASKLPEGTVAPVGWLLYSSVL